MAKMIDQAGREVEIDVSEWNAYDAYVLTANPRTLSLVDAKRAAQLRFNYQFAHNLNRPLPRNVCF